MIQNRKLEQHLANHDPSDEAVEMHRKGIEESVKTSVEKAQKKQKQYYDLKHNPSLCYTVGSLVWKKDFL